MEQKSTEDRMKEAVRLTAPGQPMRTALDMIIAGHLGALICVGDTEAVLAAGNDGFPLNISFTSNRLFELSKMDGAIVIDGGLNKILRANFHLNPDPSLATNETGMRHRTAARMSVLTNATVISVSERRGVVNVYVDGRSYQIQPVTEIMSSVNQLVSTLQTTRSSLDRALLRLTALELDDYVTPLLTSRASSPALRSWSKRRSSSKAASPSSATRGKLVQMQLEQPAGASMETEYNLMIRDYAADASEENSERIRAMFSDMSAQDLTSPSKVAAALGYEDLDEDSVMSPLGLRTLSRVSVVRDGVAGAHRGRVRLAAGPHGRHQERSRPAGKLWCEQPCHSRGLARAHAWRKARTVTQYLGRGGAALRRFACRGDAWIQIRAPAVAPSSSPVGPARGLEIRAASC